MNAYREAEAPPPVAAATATTDEESLHGSNCDCTDCNASRHDYFISDITAILCAAELDRRALTYPAGGPEAKTLRIEAERLRNGTWRRQ